MIELPYDGCGKCLLGVRRLSRMRLATSSPERQREDVLTAAASVGGHIIGWADDWEVSGLSAGVRTRYDVRRANVVCPLPGFNSRRW